MANENDDKKILQWAESGTEIREVRVAAAMVGGTSLAVHINGSTQELCNMVMGRGAYGLAKLLTASHAYVDVLSGTSAGGINAVFLAAALANGKDVKCATPLFRNEADIDALLFDPESNVQQQSLLKGEGHILPQLKMAFQQIAQAPEQFSGDQNVWSGRRQNGDGSSAYTDVDLFVTGSYLKGQPRNFFDSLVTPIYTKTHRAVFHFRNRTDSPSESDFLDLDQSQNLRLERLARAARTTSSLPAVFEPSKVDATLFNGNQRVFKVQGPYHFMGDGGYWNGRPLDLIVEAVKEKTANRAVVRKVLLVEPAPDPPTVIQEKESEVTPIGHVRDFMDISSAQSLFQILDEVATHNRQVQRTKELLGSVRNDTTTPPSKLQIEMWRKLRALELVERACDVLQKSPHAQSLSQDSLNLFRDKLLELITAKALDREVEFDSVDVYYTERLLLRAQEKVHETVSRSLAQDTLPDLNRAYERFLKDKQRLRKAVEDFLQKQQVAQDLVQNPVKIAQDFYAKSVEACGSRLLRYQAQAELIEDAQTLPDDFAVLAKELSRAQPALEKLVYDRLLEQLGAVPSEQDEALVFVTPWLEEHRYLLERVKISRAPNSCNTCRAEDIWLYPMERAAGLSTLQPIDLVMIDPSVQIALSRLPKEFKVAGASLYKFGGFLSRTIRCNDLLWGRLDCSSTLLAMLLEPQRMKDIVPKLHDKVKNGILSYLRTGNFQGQGVDSLGQFLESEHEGNLEALVQGAWLDGDVKKHGDRLREAIQTRHQLDILQEEIPKLLASDLLESSQYGAGNAWAGIKAAESFCGISAAAPLLASSQASSVVQEFALQVFRAPLTPPETKPEQGVQLGRDLVDLLRANRTPETGLTRIPWLTQVRRGSQLGLAAVQCLRHSELSWLSKILDVARPILQTIYRISWAAQQNQQSRMLFLACAATVMVLFLALGWFLPNQTLLWLGLAMLALAYVFQSRSGWAELALWSIWITALIMRGSHWLPDEVTAWRVFSALAPLSVCLTGASALRYALGKAKMRSPYAGSNSGLVGLLTKEIWNIREWSPWKSTQATAPDWLSFLVHLAMVVWLPIPGALDVQGTLIPDHYILIAVTIIFGLTWLILHNARFGFLRKTGLHWVLRCVVLAFTFFGLGAMGWTGMKENPDLSSLRLQLEFPVMLATAQKATPVNFARPRNKHLGNLLKATNKLEAGEGLTPAAKAQIESQLISDNFFALGYSTALALGCLWVHYRRRHRWFRFAARIALIAGALDLLENHLLREAIVKGNYPEFFESAGWLVPCLATTKFVLIAPAMITGLIGIGDCLFNRKMDLTRSASKDELIEYMVSRKIGTYILSAPEKYAHRELEIPADLLFQGPANAVYPLVLGTNRWGNWLADKQGKTMGFGFGELNFSLAAVDTWNHLVAKILENSAQLVEIANGSIHFRYTEDAGGKGSWSAILESKVAAPAVPPLQFKPLGNGFWEISLPQV